MQTLRLILGDQLNSEHSWYKDSSTECVYLMAEMHQEQEYVLHHIQKIAAFFGAMRAFAAHLVASGFKVRYVRITEPESRLPLPALIRQIMENEGCARFEYQHPDEYRLTTQLRQLSREIGLDCREYDTEHFLSAQNDVAQFFQGRKQLLMESFYRMMRQRYNILMQGDRPLGGQWNFDKENRHRYDAKVPLPLWPKRLTDISPILNDITQAAIKSFGSVDALRIRWPLERKQALDDLHFFVDKVLPWFGRFQDSLAEEDAFLFHSRLSFALNVKMLHPMEVIEAAIQKWEADPEVLRLADLEGFIRQILGWREYVRGIYWMKMPEYSTLNFFGHVNALPSWYWTGKTKMRCVSKAIDQSLRMAYAHHIQRLMVTGNFALLAGVHPDAVDAWYLGIYIDALEWVELPNTRGMSQYADGGILGSKPYVSSAAYIHKMGNHCQSCYYDHATKTGDRACPFNSLYWHFHARNRTLLERNPRIGMMYKTWDNMEASQRNALLNQAEKYLSSIENL